MTCTIMNVTIHTSTECTLTCFYSLSFTPPLSHACTHTDSLHVPQPAPVEITQMPKVGGREQTTVVCVVYLFTVCISVTMHYAIGCASNIARCLSFCQMCLLPQCDSLCIKRICIQLYTRLAHGSDLTNNNNISFKRYGIICLL